MKFILSSEQIRSNALSEILKLPCDGKTQVVIGKAKGKRSEAINRLMWMWYGVIQESLRDSIGQIESTDNLHEYFVNLLLPRKSIEINGLVQDVRAQTSKMNNKEMSEYLELLDNYCGSDLGISLPHPIDLFNEAMK